MTSLYLFFFAGLSPPPFPLFLFPLFVAGLLRIGRPGQPSKAFPIASELGSVVDVSEKQKQKASSPIVVTESGSVMDVSEEQPRKAKRPIVVTESGSVMDVSEEQS